DSNVFGSFAAEDRNLVSGDKQGAIALNAGSRTVIQGNYIGTDVTGTVALNAAGGRTGISGTPTSDTTVLGNLISGNSSAGVFLGQVPGGPGGGRIQGNLIGTRRDGVSPLGNNGGLFLASGFLVGGT